MRRLIGFSLLLCALVSLVQCGLEITQDIWPAPVNAGAASGIYYFTTNTEQQSDSSRLFMGYNLYYKIKAASTVYDWSNELNIDDVSKLSTNGYQLLRTSDDTSNPLSITTPVLATNNNGVTDPYTVTIDFSDVTGTGMPSATSSIGNFGPIELRRNVANTLYQEPLNSGPYKFKKFKEFISTDSDIPSVAFTGISNKGDLIIIEMCLYVVAYGKSIEQGTFWQDIISVPCCLNVNTVYVYYDDGL